MKLILVDRFKTEDEAVAIANMTSSGLAGTCISKHRHTLLLLLSVIVLSSLCVYRQSVHCFERIHKFYVTVDILKLLGSVVFVENKNLH